MEGHKPLRYAVPGNTLASHKRHIRYANRIGISINSPFTSSNRLPGTSGISHICSAVVSCFTLIAAPDTLAKAYIRRIRYLQLRLMRPETVAIIVEPQLEICFVET